MFNDQMFCLGMEEVLALPASGQHQTFVSYGKIVQLTSLMLQKMINIEQRNALQLHASGISELDTNNKRDAQSVGDESDNTRGLRHRYAYLLQIVIKL